MNVAKDASKFSGEPKPVKIDSFFVKELIILKPSGVDFTTIPGTSHLIVFKDNLIIL